MPGRKIRDEADARHCLWSLKDSGLTLVEWAREHGIDGRSLRLWGLNLWRREPISEPAPPSIRLVELVTDETAHDSPRPTVPRYVVRVAGIEVEVGDDFKEATLARLLEVVAC